ncbi:MAG: amidohydrolase family protein [Candidatus Bathyarchaeota archaeon]|nr:amidohydrolase family protein [Candidatus Bathyarchaeota archaeon]
MKVHSHRADDIAIAIRVAEEFGVKVTWEHATEGHRKAKWIAEKGVPAIWGPSLMGKVKWEMRELSFDTPKALFEACVKFAIQTDALGQSISFLPICAALTVKQGVPKDDAIKAITITPAEILGVDDRVGSLEVGKDADIRILDCDPLDIMIKTETVIIDGKVEYEA